ncbi:MAG: DNA methyltransferase [Gammaproteobacteria bacterium]
MIGEMIKPGTTCAGGTLADCGMPARNLLFDAAGRPPPLGAAAQPVRLMDNTQFVYELHLAALEIAALCGGRAGMADDMRTFFPPAEAGVESLLKRSAYVAGDANGNRSDYCKLVRHNITRSMNQYITHWFYPYKGKFHPQMIRALANIIGLRDGDVLLDPFIGSGTTAVEGALLGLKTFGFDISPLCVLIGKVKANAVHHLPALMDMPAPLLDNARNKIDLDDALVNARAGFELLARLIANSDSVRRHRNFDAQLQKNFHKMLESVSLMREACDQVCVSPAPAAIERGDARELPLGDETVDGVITSPPYSIALNYVSNDAHAMRYLGIDPEEAAGAFIGVRGRGGERIALYEEDMRKSYAEIARVLKPGRCAAIILGDATIGGNRVPTVQNCEDTFRKLGFHRMHKINKIIFGLYNVMQREDILVFQKP